MIVLDCGRCLSWSAGAMVIVILGFFQYHMVSSLVVAARFPWGAALLVNLDLLSLVEMIGQIHLAEEW